MNFHEDFKFMVSGLVLFVLVIAYVIFLHFFAKRYLSHPQGESPDSIATVYYLESSISAIYNGLDPKILKSIPSLLFSLEEHGKGLECAVCLTEVAEGERFRLLPKCQHGFHVDCINMWFQSHPTCPLCRNPVLDPAPIHKQPELNLDSITLGRTAVDEDTTTVRGAISSSPSSSSSGMVTIDIHEDEEQGTVPTRLRSLQRMLSRDQRVNSYTGPNAHADQQ